MMGEHFEAVVALPFPYASGDDVVGGIATADVFRAGEDGFAPFRSAHSLILVDAKVNGKAAILLPDTGANKTIIDARTYGNVQASRMELTSNGPGIEGNALRLRVDLEIAGRFLFSQPVSVISLGDLAQHLGVPFDGLLGQDILRQFHSVRINYDAHVIELQR